MLFRLLGRRNLRQRAINLDFSEAIHARIATSSDEMVTQLDYILSQLRSDEYEPEDDDSDDDDDDDLEDEGDDLAECDASEGETVTAAVDTPSGEQLLCSEYLRHRKDKDPRRANRSALTALTRDSPVLVRPVTPKVNTTSRRTSTATSQRRPSTASQRPVSHRGRPASGSSRPPSGRSDVGAARPSQQARPRSSRPPSARAASSASGRPQGASRSGSAGDARSRPAASRATSRADVEGDGRASVEGGPARSRPSTGPEAEAGSRAQTAEAESPRPVLSPSLPKNPPPPSDKVLAAITKKTGNAEIIGEYNSAFSTRPKVPRTPGGIS
jgi:hypothetical protein